MKPLVSILVPAYNAEKWIADTLKSAISQTWDRKEIIVVDDGSKDQTLAVVKSFESQGVSVETQKNQGAAATRNRCFELSKGDYIQWLDADDLLNREKIARQLQAVGPDEKRRLLSSEWAPFTYRFYKAEFVPTPLWHDLSPVEWLLRKMQFNAHMQTATWLVSRELTQAAGPWDTRLLGDDDGEYFCRVLLASNGVRFVPNAKVYYRQPGPGSLSYIGKSERKMVAQWRSMEMHINYIRSLEDSERVRRACVTYIQNWLLNFYPERPDLVEKANEMARSLGGELTPPHLSWKYSWIRTLFGWDLAKRARIVLPDLRANAERAWDRFMYQMENQNPEKSMQHLAN
jgi:glycosyltransferase involved in cell wall biosynthesis